MPNQFPDVDVRHPTGGGGGGSPISVSNVVNTVLHAADNGLNNYIDNMTVYATNITGGAVSIQLKENTTTFLDTTIPANSNAVKIAVLDWGGGNVLNAQAGAASSIFAWVILRRYNGIGLND